MRTMFSIVAICALAVSQLPSRMTPAAAASGGDLSASSYQLNETAPAADYELSSADVVALYTLYEKDISEVWGKMGAGATMKDAVITWLGQQAINKYCPPTAGPMTVCTNGFCQPVESGPIRSVVRSVSYAAPQRVVYRSVSRQPVFRGNERFMQRGPARRVFGRVGRGVCRVAFAPIRWLRCR